MNEDAVRLALLVAKLTRERDEARAEIAELRDKMAAAESLTTTRPPDHKTTTEESPWLQ